MGTTTTPCPITTTPCPTTTTTTPCPTTTTPCPTTTTPCPTTTTPCATTTTPCPTTTTPCLTTTTPCPTTTTPCATTAANPCDTTAKFMGKYASQAADGIASAKGLGPNLGGQWFVALSAGMLCLAALVAFGAFRMRSTRAGRGSRSISSDDREALMQESAPRGGAIE